MKILFVIPTLFSNKKHTIECVDSLVRSTSDYERKIVVVINEENSEFKEWSPDHTFIVKRNSNLKYNISKAINTGIQERFDEDYFCFVDEGMRFSENWLSDILTAFNSFENTGVIGFKPHSTFNFYHNKINENLYEVLWTDGILFTKFDRIEKIGMFDEDYFGDCETQDFCYRLIEYGNYKNYLLRSKGLSHKNVNWGQKSDKPLQLIEKASQSRKLFGTRWEEWRRSRYNR